MESKKQNDEIEEINFEDVFIIYQDLSIRFAKEEGTFNKDELDNIFLLINNFLVINDLFNKDIMIDDKTKAKLIENFLDSLDIDYSFESLLHLFDFLNFSQILYETSTSSKGDTCDSC